MANVLPRDLSGVPDGEVNPNSALIVDDGSGVFKSTPAQLVASGFPIASQPEAEAGASNSKAMTPQRVKQAIDALGVSQDVLASPSGGEMVGLDDGSTIQTTAKALSFGTFDDAAAATIPTNIDVVRTKGHSVLGVGAAEYAYDASVDATYVSNNPRSAFISSNGRGFKLGEREPDAAMFGALADDGSGSPADATAALNALGQYYRDYGTDAEAASFGSGLFKLPPGLMFRISGSLHLPWFMWGALNGARLTPAAGTALSDFDNGSMICLNVDAEDHQIKIGGGITILPRLENFELWNNDNPIGIVNGNTIVEGLKGVYSKSRHGPRGFTTNRLWASYIKSGTEGGGVGEYTDGIVIEDVYIWQHRGGAEYAIQINAHGENLRIRNISFSVEPFDQKGIHIRNCQGGSVEGVINGSHLFEQCIGLSLRNFHCENGGPIVLKGVSGSLRDSLFYNRVNSPMVEVGRIDSPSVAPPFSIENVAFSHNIPTTSTYVPVDYGPDIGDINITENRVALSVRNCFRTTPGGAAPMQTTHTAAKVAVNGTILPAWENIAAMNARDASVIGYSTSPQVRVLPGPSALNAMTFGATANNKWNAPDGTYYWRVFGLVGPVDRRCGLVFPGGEFSGAKVLGGNAALLNAATGDPSVTNPAFSAMTVWLLRGSATGAYTHQVFAPLMGATQIYDAGYNLGNGEMWQAIAGGPIAAPSVNAVKEIRLIGNSNVEIVATAAPSYGTWKVGDRAVNSAPTVGQPKAWVCTAAGTPGTWVSEGNL